MHLIKQAPSLLDICPCKNETTHSRNSNRLPIKIIPTSKRMSQDSSEPPFPAWDVGPISVPVYYLPIITSFILLAATTYRKRASKNGDYELKSHPNELEAGSRPIERTKWTAPHIGWELLRILAFITPMAMFFCLVDFGCSCLPWLSVLLDDPAPPPSLDGVGLFGGYLFLVVWVMLRSREIRCDRTVVRRRLCGWRAGSARELLDGLS